MLQVHGPPGLAAVQCSGQGQGHAPPCKGESIWHHILSGTHMVHSISLTGAVEDLQRIIATTSCTAQQLRQLLANQWYNDAQQRCWELDKPPGVMRLR